MYQQWIAPLQQQLKRMESCFQQLMDKKSVDLPHTPISAAPPVRATVDTSGPGAASTDTDDTHEESASTSNGEMSCALHLLYVY